MAIGTGEVAFDADVGGESAPGLNLIDSTQVTGFRQQNDSPFYTGKSMAVHVERDSVEGLVIPEARSQSEQLAPSREPPTDPGTFDPASEMIDAPGVTGRSKAIRHEIDAPDLYDVMLEKLSDGPDLHGRSKAIHVRQLDREPDLELPSLPTQFQDDGFVLDDYERDEGGGGDGLIDHFDDSNPYVVWHSTVPSSTLDSEGQMDINAILNDYALPPAWLPGDLLVGVLVRTLVSDNLGLSWIMGPVDDLTPLWELGQSEQGDSLAGRADYVFITETDTNPGITWTVYSDEPGGYSLWIALIRNAGQTTPGVVDTHATLEAGDLGVSMYGAYPLTGVETAITATPATQSWTVAVNDSTGTGTFDGSLGVAVKSGPGSDPVWAASGVDLETETSGYRLYIAGSGVAGHVLPGPDVTGTVFDGGNPYSLSGGNIAESEFQLLSQGWPESSHYFAEADVGTNWFLAGSPDQGVDDGPDPGGYPAGPPTAFSSRNQLLFKFRFDGSGGYARFAVLWGLSEVNLGQDFMDKSIVMFDIEINYPYNGPPEGTFVWLLGDAYNLWDGTWYGDFLPTPLAPGSYYVLLDNNTDGRIRLKIWDVNDEEPTAWLADVDPYVTNPDRVTDYNEVSIIMENHDVGGETAVDAWWARGAGGGGGGGDCLTILGALPVHDLDGAWWVGGNCYIILDSYGDFGIAGGSLYVDGGGFESGLEATVVQAPTLPFAVDDWVLVAHLMGGSGFGSLTFRPSLDGDAVRVLFGESSGVAIVDRIGEPVDFAPMTVTPFDWYWLSVSKDGSQMRAKLWRDGDAEPARAQVSGPVSDENQLYVAMYAEAGMRVELDSMTVTRGVRRGYLPTFKREVDDPETDISESIAMLEAGAMALDFHTRGEVNVWGGELIPWQDKTNGELIVYGAEITDVKKAWTHWDANLVLRSGQSWTKLLDCLGEGRAVLAAGRVSGFSAPYQHGPDEDGHGIIILPIGKGQKVLIGDPLYTDFEMVPLDEVRAYMEALPSMVWGVTKAWAASASGDFMWPVNGVVTQEYGCTGFYLEPPRGGCAHFHDGIDIAAPLGTPIYAPAAGNVTLHGFVPDGAFNIMIDHGDNVTSLIGHMQEEYDTVSVGSNVRRGQLVGHIGLTGNTSGPHLHWETRRSGVDFNPRDVTPGNP